MNSATGSGPEAPKKKLLVAKKAYKGKAPRGAGAVKMVDAVQKKEKRAERAREKKKGGKKKRHSLGKKRGNN
jgi:hypothetical protein